MPEVTVNYNEGSNTVVMKATVQGRSSFLDFTGSDDAADKFQILRGGGKVQDEDLGWWYRELTGTLQISICPDACCWYDTGRTVDSISRKTESSFEQVFAKRPVGKEAPASFGFEVLDNGRVQLTLVSSGVSPNYITKIFEDKKHFQNWTKALDQGRRLTTMDGKAFEGGFLGHKLRFSTDCGYSWYTTELDLPTITRGGEAFYDQLSSKLSPEEQEKAKLLTSEVKYCVKQNGFHLSEGETPILTLGYYDGIEVSYDEKHNWKYKHFELVPREIGLLSKLGRYKGATSQVHLTDIDGQHYILYNDLEGTYKWKIKCLDNGVRLALHHDFRAPTLENIASEAYEALTPATGTRPDEQTAVEEETPARLPRSEITQDLKDIGFHLENTSTGVVLRLQIDGDAQGRYYALYPTLDQLHSLTKLGHSHTSEGGYYSRTSHYMRDGFGSEYRIIYNTDRGRLWKLQGPKGTQDLSPQFSITSLRQEATKTMRAASVKVDHVSLTETTKLPLTGDPIPYSLATSQTKTLTTKEKAMSTIKEAAKTASAIAATSIVQTKIQQSAQKLMTDKGVPREVATHPLTSAAVSILMPTLLKYALESEMLDGVIPAKTADTLNSVCSTAQTTALANTFAPILIEVAQSVIPALAPSPEEV